MFAMFPVKTLYNEDIEEFTGIHISQSYCMQLSLAEVDPRVTRTMFSRCTFNYACQSFYLLLKRENKNLFIKSPNIKQFSGLKEGLRIKAGSKIL